MPCTCWCVFRRNRQHPSPLPPPILPNVGPTRRIRSIATVAPRRGTIPDASPVLCNAWIDEIVFGLPRFGLSGRFLAVSFVTL